MLIAKVFVSIGMLALAGAAGVGLGILEEKLDKRRRDTKKRGG